MLFIKQLRPHSAPHAGADDGLALYRETRLADLAASIGLPNVELWRRVGLEWRRDACSASVSASASAGGWLGETGATSSIRGLLEHALKAQTYVELLLSDLPRNTDNLLVHEFTFHREQLGFTTVALHPFRSDGVPYVLLAFTRSPDSRPQNTPTSPPIIPPVESSSSTPTVQGRALTPNLQGRVSLIAASLCGDADTVVDARTESPTQIYLPCWHDDLAVMTAAHAGWKSPSASSPQHLRPKISLLTVCCFPDFDGTTLRCTLVRTAKDRSTSTYVQAAMTTRQVQLRPGSHAFVRCVGEVVLRVAVASAPFGTASGHAALGAEGPTIYAGEIEVDDSGKLIRWNNMSGTYKPSADDAHRALLPLDKFWRVVSDGVFEPPSTLRFRSRSA